MCLGFNPTSAFSTSASLSALIHKDISCEGAWTGVFRSYTTSRVHVLTCIPVSGTSVVVFPIMHQHAEAIVPLPHEVSCFSRTIEGLTNPGKYVSVPGSGGAQEIPRSAAMRSASFASTTAPPPALDYRSIATRIVCNKFDSGATMLIELSTINLLGSSRDDVALCVLNAVKAGLDENQIAHERVMGAEGHDIVTGEMAFVSMLIEALVPGLDIIIGIMPEDDNDKKKTEATFSFLFDFDIMPLSIPLLGLMHNNPQAEKQHESYYLMTNLPDMKFVLSSDGLVAEVPLVPQSYKEFTIDAPAPASRSSLFSRTNSAAMMNQSQVSLAYKNAQQEFQSSLLADLDQQLAKVFKDVYTTSGFGIVDLVGMVIPSHTVSAEAKYIEAVFNSVSEMRKRKIAAAK